MSALPPVYRREFDPAKRDPQQIADLLAHTAATLRLIQAGGTVTVERDEAGNTKAIVVSPPAPPEPRRPWWRRWFA